MKPIFDSTIHDILNGRLDKIEKHFNADVIFYYGIIFDGIIPDDPEHTNDIIRRIREVLDLIWRENADAIEKETCEILGVKELRERVSEMVSKNSTGESGTRMGRSPRRVSDDS